MVQVYPFCKFGINLCNFLKWDIVCSFALNICQARPHNLPPPPPSDLAHKHETCRTRLNVRCTDLDITAVAVSRKPGLPREQLIVGMVHQAGRIRIRLLKGL